MKAACNFSVISVHLRLYSTAMPVFLSLVLRKLPKIVNTVWDPLLHSLCKNFKEFETRNKMAEAEGSKQNNTQVKKRTRNPSGRYSYARSLVFNVNCILSWKLYAVEFDCYVHFSLSLNPRVSICLPLVRLCLCFNFRMETREKKTTEGGR